MISLDSKPAWRLGYWKSLALSFRQTRKLRALMDEKMMAQYRHNGIGLLLPMLSLLLHSVLLSASMHLVFNQQWRDYIVYYSCSFAVWIAMNQFISDCASYNEQSFQLKHYSSVSRHIVHSTNIVMFAFFLLLRITVAIGIMTCVLPSRFLQIHWIGALIGVASVTICMYSMGLVISFLLDRFRLLNIFIPQILFLAYLITPILFRVDMLGGGAWIAYYNPLFYVLQAIRDPIINGIFVPANIAVTLGASALFFLIGWILDKPNSTLISYRWVA